MNRKVPGIILGIGVALDAPGVESQAGAQIHAQGTLLSRAENENAVVWMEGLFLDRDSRSPDDAAIALRVFSENGALAVAAMDGFYNTLIFDKARREFHLVSDAVATRPWYFYRQGSRFVAAPTPVTFAELGLPMTFNRTAAFETIRLCYTQSRHTLVNEVLRNRPCTLVTISENGEIQERFTRPLRHEPNMSLDRHRMGDQIYEMMRHSIKGIIEHPRLKDRPIHLPLTGGLDSRHILAELMDQGRMPSQIRHVNIQEKDFVPVRIIAEDLKIPTNFKTMETLDHRRLALQWAERSGGLANFHQSYLMDMVTDIPAGGTLGFDGYTMDFLLSVQTKTNLNATGNAVDTVWNRRYTIDFVLNRMFPDHRSLTRESRGYMEDEAAHYHGSEWFKMGMMDLFHRSIKYTGSAFCLMGDDALFFGPGAVGKAVDFFMTANPDESLDTRARLALMKKYFPKLSSYPGKYGIPFDQYDLLIEEFPSKFKYIMGMLKGYASLMRIDPVPESEHSWIRGIPILHRMHQKVIRDSELARDGLISQTGLWTSWGLLKAGLFEGWTLMSVLSIEGAYRMLVKRQSVEDVVAWLCD